MAVYRLNVRKPHWLYILVWAFLFPVSGWNVVPCHDLTPIQIRTLRAEVQRRRAFRTLHTQVGYSDAQEIATALRQHSLMQIRGVALETEDTRVIRREAEQLTRAVQAELTRVHLVHIQGHVVTLFRESAEFPLRTTGKQNAWNKRPKARRDNAGQIVP
jgi:RNA-binding protein YhbY